MSEREPVRSIVTPTRTEYEFTPGPSAQKFLRAIGEGRLVGEICPSCDKVYFPASGACARCGVATEGEALVEDRGTVTTFCVVNLQFYGQAVEVPYACCSILLDGADLPFFHLVQELPADQVRMGLRVQAVWVPPEELTPSFESIRYFKPSGEEDAPYESYKEYVS